MTTKEYRLSVALKAEVIVEVNGKAVTLQFNNGSFMGGVRRGGYCTVTDPEVQQALESSENFGPMYFCAKTTVVEDAKPKYVAPVKKETKAPAEPTADPFALVEPIKTTILPEIDESQAIDDHGIIVGITNSQKAKRYSVSISKRRRPQFLRLMLLSY